MSWLKSLSHKLEGKKPAYQAPNEAPPDWTPAPEQSHTYGLHSEATDDEFESAEAFCRQYPVDAPRLLSSDMIERIDEAGCRLWTLEQPRSSRFIGQVNGGGEKGPGITQVTTSEKCGGVCLMSNLPLLAGLYNIQGKSGVYYEICIRRMDGIIAVGTASKPYPDWRFPGWNRTSVGLHLDDMRKFYEDPTGGCDYTPILQPITPGDTIGCGYDFITSGLFFTYNGHRLPDAFNGVYVPLNQLDVYAAIGVEGACEFEVNFGGDLFRWKEGNEWAWRVEGHVGKLSGASGSLNDEPPSYEEVRRTGR